MRIKIELFRDVFIQRAVLGRMSRPRRLRTDLALMQILKRFRVDPYLRLPTLRPQGGRGEVRSQIRSYRYGLTFDIEGTWVLCGLRFVRFRLQALSV